MRDLRPSASSAVSPFRILALLFFSVLSVAAGPFTVPVTRCADEILRRQTSDGAIVMGGIQSTNNISPYFANLAAIGLVKASQETGNRRYLSAAEHWFDWYAARMNPNGTVFDYTGTPAAWRSTGDFDSTDSYAATALELLDAIEHQDKVWACARYARASRAIAAIRLTLQANGLTLAKPGWPIAYTMDNIEAMRGLRAAARMAAVTGHPADAAAWGQMASRMEASIATNLWDTGQAAYLVGIQSNGARFAAQNTWYPGLMADLMAVGLGQDSSRNRNLYQRLIAEDAATIPARAATENDVEHLVWWGYAARSAGDQPRFEKIQAELSTAMAKPLPVANTALLGHVCRLLAGQ